MRARPLKVLLKTPFSLYSGYGNDGFGLLRALHEWGCDVYPQPMWLDVPIPQDLLPLFGKTLHGPFDLLLNHWDPDNLFITREARQNCRVAVAWTMWEFAAAPDNEDGTRPLRPCRKHEKLNGQEKLGVPGCPQCKPAPRSGLYPHAAMKSTLRKRLRWYDMVLGYDPVSEQALAPFTPKPVHLGYLLGGYDSRYWKPVERDWFGDRFQFFMHGALNNRKVPWTTIEAWHKLKDEKGEAFKDAKLALHTVTPGTIFPELNVPFAHVGIKVFVSALDMAGVQDLYSASHCLLSPSRGEGKNLPALEFMTTGGVVAATNFGGHTQWLGGDWAYPLDYTLGATFGTCPWGAHDAKVSVEHLADTIWHIYTHRDEARNKARLAQELMPKMHDWQVVIENLFRKIRDEVKGPGPAIYDQAMECKRDIQLPLPGSLVPGVIR